MLAACEPGSQQAVAVGPAEAQPPADSGSPQQAVAEYIGSLRTGDLAGVQRVTFDYDDFNLPGPLPIDSFRVIRSETLDSVAAAERSFTPAPKAGDVELDVVQYEAGAERKYSYSLREIDGHWRIYAHAAWGSDVEVE
jgi:hypothetical protein